ncbi:MAG: hypothetical protein C4563_08835 [Desulfobulbus sp.]|nr:MAG: hypothetical protein C4563_08835 [Desulfobulbus sp.]
MKINFVFRSLFLAQLLLLAAPGAHAALDPPHDTAGCLSCHDMTSTEANLLPPLGHPATSIDETPGNVTCEKCHLYGELGIPAVSTTHSSRAIDGSSTWTVECSVCHNQHLQEQEGNGSTYGKFIRRSINLANIKGADGNPLPGKSGDMSVVFTGPTGPNSFADGEGAMDGICEVCHTQTNHFRNDGTAPDQLHSKDQNGNPARIGPGNDCTVCHRHENGFAVDMPSHSAAPGSDWVIVFEEGTHDSVMVGDGAVYAECRMCHNTELSAAHDYQCLVCHPSPAETVVGSWAGGCQQGGCHSTFHADVSAAHNAVDDDCSKCHGPDWWPTSAECANCHALYNPADTTPPVTTSNAKTSYLGPARIEYTVRDGGKVVVAQSYSRVDGGPDLMGSSILVTETGDHTLEFWSVDQANNEESPPKEAQFNIIDDTTPPVTTSNAQTSYYNFASISLTATDDGDLGPKTTYYSLDGEETKTGTSVYVSGATGTFDHALDFWSEDWSGNVETATRVDFSITKGTGTFRMWGGGTSCANDPDADAFWIIKRNDYNGTVLAEGTDGCNVDFPVGPTIYFIMVEWWNPDGYWDEDYYGTYSLTSHGDVIELN